MSNPPVTLQRVVMLFILLQSQPIHPAFLLRHSSLSLSRSLSLSLVSLSLSHLSPSHLSPSIASHRIASHPHDIPHFISCISRPFDSSQHAQHTQHANGPEKKSTMCQLFLLSYTACSHTGRQFVECASMLANPYKVCPRGVKLRYGEHEGVCQTGCVDNGEFFLLFLKKKTTLCNHRFRQLLPYLLSTCLLPVPILSILASHYVQCPSVRSIPG